MGRYPRELLNKYFSLIIIFLVSIITYWLTQSSYVGFGDPIGILHSLVSKDFIATNATNHFFYKICLYSFSQLFSNYSIIRVGSWFSALFSALSLCMVYLCALKISKNSIASLCTSVLLMLSFTWWWQSVIIEIYTFNSFILLSLFYLSLKIFTEKNHTHTYWASVLMAILILTSIQNILILPYYSFCILVNNSKLDIKNILSFRLRDANYFPIISNLLILILIGSPIFLIPFFLKTNGYIDVFFEGSTHNQTTILKFNILSYFKSAIKGLFYLIYNFHVFIILIFIGLKAIFKKNVVLFAALMFLIVPTYLFGSIYNVSDQYVFFVPAYLFLIISSSMGFLDIIERFPKFKYLLLSSILITPNFYFCTWKAAENCYYFNQFNTEKAYKGGIKYYVWPGNA